ncbi:MAG TPA: hypothetical protein VHE60_04970 [Pyrinomonadaceae bacterium]|nr:hypothetical protein [Pyrinomonadaceae bacterium]
MRSFIGRQDDQTSGVYVVLALCKKAISARLEMRLVPKCALGS